MSAPKPKRGWTISIWRGYFWCYQCSIRSELEGLRVEDQNEVSTSETALDTIPGPSWQLTSLLRPSSSDCGWARGHPIRKQCHKLIRRIDWEYHRDVQHGTSEEKAFQPNDKITLKSSSMKNRNFQSYAQFPRPSLWTSCKKVFGYYCRCCLEKIANIQ